MSHSIIYILIETEKSFLWKHFQVLQKYLLWLPVCCIFWTPNSKPFLLEAFSLKIVAQAILMPYGLASNNRKKYLSNWKDEQIVFGKARIPTKTDFGLLTSDKNLSELRTCRPAFFSIKSWKLKDKRWLVLMVARRVTRIFLGRGVFSELGHFDKQSTTARERNTPQGKTLQAFYLKTLKMRILNENFFP